MTHYTNKEDIWIKEEELLLTFAENKTFIMNPLEEILVTIIYVDRNQDIIDTFDQLLPLKIHAHKSILEWVNLKQHINSHLKHNDMRFVLNDISYYHLSINYEQLDLFKPSSQLIKLERDKDLKLVETLPVLHDISQIFVILREIIPISAKNSLKSILKNGAKIGKTKRVRISENYPEVFSSSSRRTTRKT
jgi:hypothetical protein